VETDELQLTLVKAMELAMLGMAPMLAELVVGLQL
jgi:hypothetical protein